MDLAESHLDVPYEQRWELLKPTIVNIYLEERVTLARLAKRMADDFGFKAETHQYRYHFKKWKIKKRITTAEKEDVITVLGKRRRQHGIGTSNIQLEQGGWFKPVDKKQLKRYINNSMRTERPLSIRPGLFLSRSLPSSALFGVPQGHVHDNPSPLSNGPPTPAYLIVSSPPDQRAAPSPQEGMSPTTQLVHRKVLMDRAHLLLDGRELDLMKQMSKEERRATANWLHDFWLFSFITTKYWGKGPQIWTLPLIKFKTLAGVADGSTGHQPNESQELNFTQSNFMATGADPPSQLCNWSIHIEDERIDYEPVDSEPSRTASKNADQFGAEDESTWKAWNAQHGLDLTSTIIQGLQANAFTTLQAEDLPIAIDQIVNAVSGSVKDANAEAIGFTIMTRNVDALEEFLQRQEFNRQALRTIAPFHLAARFLDGSKTCCEVIWLLVSILQDDMSIGVNYTDNLGMTVLDTLFMTILRSHSSVSPSSLGTKFFAPSSNFEGVDVDICGRWDADSPAVRHLHATGRRTIPHEWKHVFCHTSAQAMCHFLTAMFTDVWAPNINTASGLFQRRCHSCGSELKLGPLHAFVLVCFHLANEGRPGETLFGMLACLLCLLTLRADPCLSAEISLLSILELRETEECQHRPFNAAELASAVPNTVVNAWAPEVKLGWEAIKEVLNHCVRRAQAEMFNLNEVLFYNSILSGLVYGYNENTEGSYGSGSGGQTCRHSIHRREKRDGRQYVKCGDKHLGIIWAAIQVELLTYRRLQMGDPWLSSKFDLRNVIEGLQTSDDSILMRLVKSHGEGAFQNFSNCGLFLMDHVGGCVRREDACASYFTNLDDWKRTTFIPAREWIDI